MKGLFKSKISLLRHLVRGSKVMHKSTNRIYQLDNNSCTVTSEDIISWDINDFLYYYKSITKYKDNKE